MQGKKINHIIKTKTQNLSLLSKENIILKHDRKIKISFIDLTPYLHQEFGFIDPDFPHVYTSINQNQNPPNEGVQWMRVEQLHENSNYSDLISNLQTNLFRKKSISHALIITNWFANVIFSEIFINELSNYHLYEYDVMIDGVFVHMPIDSYVPINSNNKQQIFTENYKGSVFPCLYEKLLAKIYGDYESITSQFIQIVQLQTFYCRQQISLTGEIKQKQIQRVLQQKLKQKSIVSFRTRNSIRLQSFGLQSNYVYIILRILQRQQGCLIQFLQLDGQSWIGKHSKLRSSWLLQQEYIQKRQIIRSEQYKQNYMSLTDMKGIGRQLIILNNTLQYHKNYYISSNSQSYFNLYKLQLTQTNKCMIRINFKHKKCYSSIYIIQKQAMDYKLIKSVFRQNKQSLYVQQTLNSGQYFVIVYNTHSQQQTLPYNFTLFASNQFVQIVAINSPNETLNILEKAFLGYFNEQYKSYKESILFKQLYNLTGLSFIYVRPSSNSLSIHFNNPMLEQSKIFGVNLKPVQNQFTIAFQPNKQGLIIFRCLWSRKENIDFDHQNINSKEQIQKIIFPPIGSIKVYQKTKK